MSTGDPALTSAFRSLARQLFVIGSVEQTLHRIAALAVELVPGTDYAGVSLLRGGEVTTPAWSDPLVLQVDDAQYAVDEGPCLSAIRKHATFKSDDLATDGRWRRFGPKATELGVASAMAMRLHTSSHEDPEVEPGEDVLVDNAEPDPVTLGALNLYARAQGSFGFDDGGAGAMFAAYASVALEAAEAYGSAQAQAEGLRIALESRDVIGQAKGVLMAERHVTADEAFDILRTTSQRLNVKLREIAQRVAETGALPDDPE